MGILDIFRKDDPNEVIAECGSGHSLTQANVASGTCPIIDCPTPELFPGKGPVPDEAGEEDR